MVEYASKDRAMGHIERSVRAAMRLGNCTRATAVGLNKRRAQLGLPQFSLDGVQTPAERKLRRAKALAGYTTIANAIIARAEASLARARGGR
jgi:hypothetical protein